MKRNWFLTVILTAAFCGMIFGVVYLNNPELFEKEKEHVAGARPEVQWREAVAERGTMPHTYEAAGIVDCVAPDGYMETIVVEDVTDTNFTIFPKKGDEVEAQDALYSYRKKEQKLQYRAKVADIGYEAVGNTKNAVIRLLNYDKLCISTAIGSDMLRKITYETEVAVRVGDEEYQGVIEDIDYRILNGTVAVRLSCSGRLLPGTAAEVVFVYESGENALRVPADMIYQTGSVWHAQVDAGGRLETRILETGQWYEDPSDGILYVEILNGVKEGEKLIVEEIKAGGQSS